jgi:hypothetical protein
VENTAKSILPGTVIELPKQHFGTQYGVVMGVEEVLAGGVGSLYPRVQVLTGLDTWETIKDFVFVKPDFEFKLAPEKETLIYRKRMWDLVGHFSLRPSYVGVTIGADPELFVLNPENEVVPAWAFLASESIAKMKTGTPAFWDGFQAEIAPAGGACLEMFGDNIRTGLIRVLGEARKTINNKCKLTIQNSVKLSQSVLEQASEEQIAFRCSASQNVYSDAGNPPPNPREYPWRYAGGHIHLGLPKYLPAVKAEIIKALDGILGIAGVSLADGLDSPERRTMYGRAGEFRLPKHGIEYRVLSNFWLCHPAIMHLVFELARSTVRMAVGGFYRNCWVGSQDHERIQTIINGNDVPEARKMLKANLSVLYCMLKDAWPKKLDANELKTTLDVLMNGVDAGVSDPLDIHGNWDLEGRTVWQSGGRHSGGQWASQVQSKLCPVQSAGAAASTLTL